MSLLAESQTVNLASSAFNVFVISARSLPSRKTLVSSANKIANNFSETFGRSFMQSKKKRGYHFFYVERVAVLTMTWSYLCKDISDCLFIQSTVNKKNNDCRN